jgi:hypothetical protein
MNNTDYFNYLISFLSDFSLDGQDVILNDLKRVETQLLCIDGNRKGIKLVAVPRVESIKTKIVNNNINKKDKKFLDSEIEWGRIKDNPENINHIQNAAKLIVTTLKRDYVEKKDTINPIILLNELKKSNNFSIFRKLSVVKYESVSPGITLVGKQYNHNPKNPGYVIEHIIPNNFFFKELELIVKDESPLDFFDKMCLKLFAVNLNSDDDLKLKQSGLNKKMPNNWTWDDCPFERYNTAGIDLKSIKKI